MTMIKYDRKPSSQGFYAGFVFKGIAAVIAIVMQMAVCAEVTPPEGFSSKLEWPAEVPVKYTIDDTEKETVWLLQTDSGGYNSLNTGSEDGTYYWSDKKAIHETDTQKVYFVPKGLGARTKDDGSRVVIPIIYSAGRIYPRALAGKTTTFNDLRLLGGGYLDHGQVGKKYGKITILAKDPNHPAILLYNQTYSYVDNRAFNLGVTLIGEENSQLKYSSKQDKDIGKGYLVLIEKSNWKGFLGTLSVDDGLGIKSFEDVSIETPGTVKFGDNGILNLMADNAPYSFGNLIFEEGGAITNTGDGATLTVTGTFDTGKNCIWHSRNKGTFGTLKLGDGLTLIDDQSDITTVLTVTDKLEVGKNITIKCPSAKICDGTSLNKSLIFKISPTAVKADLPDFSAIKVELASTEFSAHLEVEEDPDQEGGRLVYATYDSSKFAYYKGDSEWNNDDPNVQSGDWLNPDKTSGLWSDNAYPDGDKIYCITKNLVFPGNKTTTFTGKMLVCRNDLYMLGSAEVANLFLEKDGRIYSRNGGLHLGGNLTVMDNSTIRQLLDRTFYLDATLHGSQPIDFNSYYPDKTKGGATFYLTADNSDWTGKLTTSWTIKEDAPCIAGEENHVRIVVSNANSLGGNPIEFIEDAITLDDYAEIQFTDTTVQTAANRGLYVTDGILNVAQGKTADLLAPVTVPKHGILRKIGDGTLGFGGGITFKHVNNSLLVQAGAIKGRALKYGQVTFSEGAAIAADKNSGAMNLTGVNSINAGETIYLTADGNTLEEPTKAVVYPVVKVTAAQAAEFGAKFKARKSPWRGWPVTVVSETDADGNVTYSVKYEKKSFVMSIR